MSDNKTSIEINNRTLSLEINKIGKQADGSAFLRYGDTIMFATATSKKEMKEKKSFLPLIVDYRENTYAAGKIPGGFFKRQGRPSEREILVSRLIDRPVRTLFPEGYHYDTQIIALLLSADLENEPDALGIIAASAALYCSDIPFTTPVGAVKVGYINNEFIINPTAKQLEESPINMVVVGTEEGIVMIEAGATEVEEEKIIEGIILAQKTIDEIIKMQKDLYSKLNIQKREFSVEEIDQSKLEKIENNISSSLRNAILAKNKKEREEATKQILNDLLETIPEENEDEIDEVKEIFQSIHKKLTRDLVLNEKKRSDGRDF
ncbi:MAG: polyribonucleotide nucleotidyltransferase, partial [Candidatus Aminicenantes bacterium]|nr:polyribonucleotide nucleotidyltransferase [Candidatus Aminicenantes bacterium]